MNPLIMGILNFTPNSFSDGGRYFEPHLALEHMKEMTAQGADIIDLGCNSTGPGVDILSSDQEMLRLKSVLPVISQNKTVPLSVDTFYTECAEYSLENGADIINDVSGCFNNEIANLAVKYNASYVVMHNSGGADSFNSYSDGIINNVNSFFNNCINQSKSVGLRPEKLILDPGFGFGKTKEDNLKLLKNLNDLKHVGYKILVGVSRKRFVRAGDIQNSDFATLTAQTYAVLAGADIIRAHNVFAASEMRRVLTETEGA